MLKIGCHLSISKGFKAIGKDALKIHANTFQFFTRNPRGSKAKEIDPKDAEALRLLMKENQFVPILAHAPYTLNACSPEEKTREFATQVMADDLVRMEYLPNNLYNFHPGSHGGQGAEVGIRQIIVQLNTLLKPGQTTTVLLETMAGKGTEVGRTFEELRQILDGVNLSEKMGVCLDTCHIYDAGYDIVNDLDGVLDTFDQVIRLERLLAIHLNDSMNPKGSHKDRHAKIGEGSIGLKAITQIINHPKLRHLPFFLETPNDISGHAEEIALLKDAYEE
ncbi:deoxyribonuclease IV [Desulfosporosinus metallidurans]|uniref:deoxyribonuclease IV n=1 Tax=Desulfosporosinus metallidurans TaxID=1888891 RepID=UPI00094CFFCF|nr:deoxyribonuclease IV [Desulfosporosinus metallidurans]